MFDGKRVKFSLEFVRRLVERDIISAFGNDLDEARRRIVWKMRNESVVIANPNEKYRNQSWCLINIERIGLVKIPITETARFVKAITIACPVTDPTCVAAYRKKFIVR